jgi:hypothetical protein
VAVATRLEVEDQMQAPGRQRPVPMPPPIRIASCDPESGHKGLFPNARISS